MRWLRLCGLLIRPAAWAPVWRRRSLPQPPDGPGCIGLTTAEECVRWLRADYDADEGFLADLMARRHQVDVSTAERI